MFSNKTRIAMLNYRKNILAQRDAMTNVNIIKKIKRRIRMLEQE